MKGGTGFSEPPGAEPVSATGNRKSTCVAKWLALPSTTPRAAWKRSSSHAHDELVDPVEVEVLVVDRVRELVREHEVLDPVELGVARVDELLVLGVVEAEDRPLLVRVEGLQVPHVGRERPDRLPCIAPPSVEPLGVVRVEVLGGAADPSPPA